MCARPRWCVGKVDFFCCTVSQVVVRASFGQHCQGRSRTRAESTTCLLVSKARGINSNPLSWQSSAETANFRSSANLLAYPSSSAALLMAVGCSGQIRVTSTAAGDPCVQFGIEISRGRRRPDSDSFFYYEKNQSIVKSTESLCENDGCNVKLKNIVYMRRSDLATDKILIDWSNLWANISY